jgi:hypothetical protein
VEFAPDGGACTLEIGDDDGGAGGALMIGRVIACWATATAQIGTRQTTDAAQRRFIALLNRPFGNKYGRVCADAQQADSTHLLMRYCTATAKLILFSNKHRTECWGLTQRGALCIGLDDISSQRRETDAVCRACADKWKYFSLVYAINFHYPIGRVQNRLTSFAVLVFELLA